MAHRHLPPILKTTKKSLLAPLYERQRAQLIGALLVAVVLPFLARYMLNSGVNPQDQISTSILVSIGVLISHFVNQKFSKYPFKDPISSTLPATVFGFTLLIVLILVNHLQYSRMLLFLGFVATLFWYMTITILRNRWYRMSLAIVPVGITSELVSIAGVHWYQAEPTQTGADLNGIDGIVIDFSSDLPRSWIDFIVDSASLGIPVYDSSELKELLTGRVSLDRIRDIGLDTLLPNREYLYIKSIVDWTLAITIAPIVLLIVLVCGIAIKLDSPGSILFIQRRMGFRGKEFYCYKLRTMYDNADVTGPVYTIPGDRRITRVGRVLRRFHLDELPQLVNILKGEMSWIGPRPEALALSTLYEAGIDYYRFRHSVKPGITGWAAIHQGNVANLNRATEKLQFDFFYIKNVSAMLDLFISLKTGWIILKGMGSK